MKTGWIIEIVHGILHQSVGRTFYSAGRKYATLILVEAFVFRSRGDARELRSGNDDEVRKLLSGRRDEVVRKVELDDLGRAVQIIPGR